MRRRLLLIAAVLALVAVPAGSATGAGWSDTEVAAAPAVSMATIPAVTGTVCTATRAGQTTVTWPAPTSSVALGQPIFAAQSTALLGPLLDTLLPLNPANFTYTTTGSTNTVVFKAGLLDGLLGGLVGANFYYAIQNVSAVGDWRGPALQLHLSIPALVGTPTCVATP